MGVINVKKFLKVLIIFNILVFPISSINALENEECTFYPAISEFCELEKGPVLILNEKKNDTYWQFKDIDAAFNSIKEIEAKLIDQLSSTYNLESLSYTNWKDYKNALDYEIYVNNMTEDIHTTRLNTFFDVCDNQDRNTEIKKIYDSKSYSMSELAILLPYTSPYYIEYSETPSISPYASFNVANAVSYASQYAYSYNYSYQVWLNGDCTNFASQIARAGGIPNRGNVNTGWYYGGVDKNSPAWRIADSFVKYWKVSYSTTNFNNFSKNVSKGKFIAYDSNSDGKWNHVAFVTATKSGTTSAGYRDFKVAQHTKNYHAWVSSDTNGWESVSGIKAVIVTPS